LRGDWPDILCLLFLEAPNLPPENPNFGDANRFLRGKSSLRNAELTELTRFFARRQLAGQAEVEQACARALNYYPDRKIALARGRGSPRLRVHTRGQGIMSDSHGLPTVLAMALTA
jgi:hypothetical protein